MSEADRVPGARRKRRSSGEIMDRLLAAAEAEFKAGGYVGGTTAAIARRADITEAQLFRYFPSKAALFRRAMVKPLDDHFQGFLVRQGSRQPSGNDIRGDAAAYISELIQFIAEHERMFLSLVTAEAYPFHDIAGLTGVDGLQEYFDHGSQILKASGRIEAGGDPDLMVRVSFAAVLACVIFRDWLLPAGKVDSRAMREAVIRFVLYGIYGEPPGDPAAPEPGA